MQKVSLLLLLGLLLAACAPSAEPERVRVEQLSGPVSFYPHETGAVWQYLPDGDPLNATRLFQKVEGPTLVQGELWTAWRTVGRGLDITAFRQYGDDGVYLLREIRPGTQITFTPPLQEFPAPGALQVGASWGGETTASLFFPQATAEDQNASLTVQYTYAVVDRRKVSVAAGTLDVFVLNFESSTRDAEGKPLETLSQELWFAPFVGEVRTELGYFLIEKNFATQVAAQ